MQSDRKLAYIKDISSESYKYSFNKDKVLKTNEEVFFDLVNWYVKYQEIDRNYFLRGADIKGSKTFNYPTRLCVKIRDEINNLDYLSGLNYTLILTDKYLTWLTLSQASIKTPEIYAYSKGCELVWVNKPKNGTPVFIKERYGIGGSSVISGLLYDDSIAVEKENISISSIHNKKQIIIQEKIFQHSSLSAINSNAVNTIKITTSISKNRIINPHFCFIRIGTLNSGIMDNFSCGSIIFDVDIRNGTLSSEGFYKYAFFDPKGVGKTSLHPDTGLNIGGFSIPMFDECIRLAVSAHNEIPYIHSIGWDVAITPSGPVIIEGNPRWDTAFAQISAGPEIMDKIFSGHEALINFRKTYEN